MNAPVHPLVAQHRALLDRALQAIDERAFWTPYPESPSPKVYGEAAAGEGSAAFQARLGKPFELSQPGTSGTVSAEVSPFGTDLGISYPRVSDVEALLAAMKAAIPAWRDAGAEVRAAVCLEILDRINKRSFEMAHAVHQTTGQAFVMAFQAGGPHAQDRGLEAVAYGYAAQAQVPAASYWEKPQGSRDPLRMAKTFHVVPRGIALVIGCNTFPTWNSYPGLFASLVTGNPVLVKPHPRAVLPLAITVEIAREVLAEQGFSPDLVTLFVEGPDDRVAGTLATHPDVRLIDFTGGPEFGTWLERNAPQAQVFTEKAGLNTVVIDSTDDFRGLTRNLAFALSLYSGQMCTTPQNFLIPRDGIETDEGHKSFDEVAGGIAQAVSALLADDASAVELTGAIVNPDVQARVDGAAALGRVVLATREVTHPSYPNAVVRTPALVALDADDAETFERECFGPVSFAIATADTAQSIELFRSTVGRHGALTAGVYSTDNKVLNAVEEASVEVGVALSCNLTGGVFVNQSAAFSDFHGTGANPAANSALTDAAFVASRFRVVQSRRHVTADVQQS